MLVLSRKKNESIVINNDITVTVVEIRGDKVSRRKSEAKLRKNGPGGVDEAICRQGTQRLDLPLVLVETAV